MKRLMGILIALGLFVFVAPPAFAQGPRDHVCFGGSTLVRPEEAVQSVVLFGCGARIQSGARVQRDVVSFGGDVVLEEDTRVEGDVVVFGGNLQIAGQVSDEVVGFGGRVMLEPTAVVERNIIVMGGSVDRKEGAVVRGRIEQNGRVQTHVQVPPIVPRVPPIPPIPSYRDGEWGLFSGMVSGFFRSLFGMISLAALGALLLVFLPTQLNQVAVVAQNQAAPSLGVGCLTWLVVPPLMILFVVTCLGIPLALVLGIAFVAAIALGWLAISAIVGERLLSGLKAKNIVPILAMVVGVVVLWLVTAVPILGWIVWLFIAALAVGAVVLTRFGTRPYPPTAVASVAPTPPIPPVTPSTPPPSDDSGANI